MSLFNFVKEAGAKLFGMGENQTPEEKISEIKKMVTEEHNLPIKFFNCTLEDDKVIMTGIAQDMATQEKSIVAVGNINGIGSVENCMTIAPKETSPSEPLTADAGEVLAPEAKFYTVKSGDTLGAIAKNFYGNAGKYPVIFEANKPMLKDPNKIYPGQTLRIPNLENQSLA